MNYRPSKNIDDRLQNSCSNQQWGEQITSAQSVQNILLENSGLKDITIIYTTAELKSYLISTIWLVGVPVSTRHYYIHHGIISREGLEAIAAVKLILRAELLQTRYKALVWAKSQLKQGDDI